jgi:uncharacterized membrane protein YbhN (UPF0104 family)
MPEELNPRHLRRRLIQFALFGVLVGVVVLIGPGLGSVRKALDHASPGWLVVAVVFEVLSALCYVVIFRAVFCPLMSWRLSYQIGMAEQAANSVLSVSGTGGLALGAWALHRGGMSTEHIARRSVAFFFLTSLANVWTLILFAILYAAGVFPPDRNGITYAFGAVGLVATLLVMVALPRLKPREPPAASGGGLMARAKATARFARNSLGQGVRDALKLMRTRPIGVFGGSFGVTGFDLLCLGMCFKAFGASPSVGVLVIGYLIGQLGGSIPIPGGILGLDAGLIGVFVLLHVPVGPTTAAVLIYHGISLWVPGLMGTVAFVQLRRTLAREEKPAAMCAPLAEPVQTVRLPAAAGEKA